MSVKPVSKIKCDYCGTLHDTRWNVFHARDIPLRPVLRVSRGKLWKVSNLTMKDDLHFCDRRCLIEWIKKLGRSLWDSAEIMTNWHDIERSHNDEKMERF